MALAVAATGLNAQPYLVTPAELSQLATKAKTAMAAPIATVTAKTIKSPSGDAHDYVSFARYLWPDPTKPGGLPYVSHDGRDNHEQVALGDRARIGTFCETVAVLSAAWKTNRDEAAARRAGEWLRAWLITPATRMNPNLNYAQVALGQNNNFGRAAGVLDSRDLTKVIDGLALLDDSPALAPAEKTAIREWFAEFLTWLTTAPNALAERRAKNNHGTWYFAQVIPIARYLGRDDLARTLIEENKVILAHQIKADGSQPEEIRRVDGLGYSRFNLDAHAVVARLAAGMGIDLWGYTAPNGANLRQAVKFLAPYNQAPSTWPYSQKKVLAPGFLDPLLAEAGLLPADAVQPAKAARPEAAR